MPRRYFDLIDDVYVPGRWELGHPTDSQGKEVDDLWRFMEGQPVHVTGRLRVPVDAPGRALDFSHAGLSAPVVRANVANLFLEMAPDDVQLIPVDVPGQPDPFFLLVATQLIRCIDDERSTEVRYWKPEDGRPEKVGQYRSVYRLRIDPSKVGDAKVFRTWGWPILIVSEDIKRALEKAKATGLRFTEV